MAMAIESFTIREYAEKMRRIDMGKCWPFGCEGREVKGRLLPPISLKKFRWWADELESERTNEEPTPARVGGRGKQKVPKKRSIVELFAVAPQIEAVEDEEREDLDDGELERGEGNVGFDLDEEVEEINHLGLAVIRRKEIRLKQIKKQKKKKKKIISSKMVCDSNPFTNFRRHLSISEGGKVKGETGDAFFLILLDNFAVEVVLDSSFFVQLW